MKISNIRSPQMGRATINPQKMVPAKAPQKIKEQPNPPAVKNRPTLA